MRRPAHTLATLHDACRTYDNFPLEISALDDYRKHLIATKNKCANSSKPSAIQVVRLAQIQGPAYTSRGWRAGT